MQTPDRRRQRRQRPRPVSDEVAAAPDTTAGSAPVARASGTRADWQVLATLVPFLKPFTGRISFALALVLAGKLANLAVPMVLKHLVDQLNVPKSLLVLPVALLLAYGASRVAVTLFTELRQVVFARVMARVSRRRDAAGVPATCMPCRCASTCAPHGGVARDVERGGTAISDLLDWTLYTIVPTIVEIAMVTAVLAYYYDWGFVGITFVTLVPTSPSPSRSPSGARATTAPRWRPTPGRTSAPWIRCSTTRR
jgi:ATP-binding cassette subfamily B protein